MKTHTLLSDDLQIAINAVSRIVARAYAALPSTIQNEAQIKTRCNLDAWEELFHAYKLEELDILATLHPALSWMRGLLQRIEAQGRRPNLALVKHRHVES